MTMTVDVGAIPQGHDAPPSWATTGGGPNDIPTTSYFDDKKKSRSLLPVPLYGNNENVSIGDEDIDNADTRCGYDSVNGGGPDDDGSGTQLISKRTTTGQQVLAPPSRFKQASPNQNKNKLLGRNLPPLKPPSSPGRDGTVTAVGPSAVSERYEIAITRKNSSSADDSQQSGSDHRSAARLHDTGKSKSMVPQQSSAAGIQPVLLMAAGKPSTANKAHQRSAASRTQQQMMPNHPQHYPEMTDNLPPQNRLEIILKELEVPHNKVVCYFQQADLLRLTEAIRQLRLIPTWESEQPSALDSLVDIVDRTEKLLRAAMSAQMLHGDIRGKAMLDEVLKRSEDCFIKVASLDVLLPQLESRVSSLWLLSEADESAVVRLIRATAARLANDMNKAPGWSSSKWAVGTDGNAVNLLQHAVAIWIKAIGRLSSECVLITPEGPLHQFVLRHILLHEDIDVIFQAVLQLLQGSISNLSLKQTLELLVSDKKLRMLSAANHGKFINDVMLPFLDSNVVCSSSPSDLLTLLANLVIDALGSQEAALTSLVEKMDFKNFGSAAFPQALIVASLTRNQSHEGRQAAQHRSQHQQCGSFLLLLRSLAKARKLGYLFNNPDIAKGCKREVTEAYNGFFPARSESLNTSGPLFDQILDRCAAEQGVPHISTGADANLHRAFLSPLVVCHAGTATKSPVQIQYLTMLMLLALASSGEEQDELSVPSPVSRDQNHLICQLHLRLCETFLYFHDCIPADMRGHDKATHIHAGLQKESTKLFDVVSLRLRQMCSSKQTGWSLKTRIEQILETMHHFINIDKDQLAFLLQCRGKLDKFSTGIDAVTDAFDVFTVKRGAPHKWKTSDIPGMIFYYFCFAKYPLSSYKAWVADSLESTTVSGDVQQPSKAEIDDLFSNFEGRRDRLHGRDNIAKIGFKCMHNSQAFAVIVALRQVCQNISI